MELPKHYDFKEAEARWQKTWAENKLYRFDPSASGELFSIDTPPPTVSGKLHIGHVFSYTQTEIIARYMRMNGRNVYYPFGFDDNGLPTEMLTEREHGVRGESLTREEFTKLCLDTSAKYSTLFRDLWLSLGFTADFDTAYSTISDSSRRISQRSFLDLLRQDLVYRREMPTLWCTGCKTAFAQAEIEDKPKAGKFRYLNFKTPDGADIPIATTRPELLSSCVAVFIHPENPKFKALIGGRAIVPLFGHDVPILADEKADPEKGTGVVMCCTFGDTTDIDWWKTHQLPLRISFQDDGRMNELAGPFANLKKTEAREKIVEALRETGALYNETDIAAETRVVNTHERCGTEVEYLVKKQWFIKIVDQKDELIRMGEKVNWYPSHMGIRYRHWVENLGWDWAVSRQRFFGVPIPVWYCADCPRVLVPRDSDLPINPLVDKPHKPCECGSSRFIPERDVLDTWATSSVTPEINSRWGEEDERFKFRPMSIRPQAHDIIRTWAFYTIVKSYYHFKDIPWKDAVISGHTVKKGIPENAKQDQSTLAGKEYTRKSKISKSKDGDQFSPQKLIETHSADAIRWWTASGKLGTDVVFDEQEVVETNRLLTKIWNASRFALQFIADYDPQQKPKEFLPVDRWFLSRLNRLVGQYHQNFAEYEFHPQRIELQNTFWHDFCDHYIELVKHRLYHTEGWGEDAALAARHTLYHGLLDLLKLFAPYIPHITEEIYQLHFRTFEGADSLHQTHLPVVDPAKNDPEAEAAGDLLCELVGLVRGYKTRNQFSQALAVKQILVVAPVETNRLGRMIARDLAGISQSAAVVFVDEAPDGIEFMEETLLDGKLRISVEMDPDALRGAQLAATVKAAVNEAKKPLGLKSKDPVKALLIDAPAELAAILEADVDRLKYQNKAEHIRFESLAEGVDAGEGIRVAVEV